MSRSIETIRELLPELLGRLDEWQSGWGRFEADETLAVPEGRAVEILGELLERLRENYPFFHPRYAGQMLKPPHYVATMAYFLAQQINPNNHALDGGPATARMETEVIAQLAAMFGYSGSLGHLTSSGTIANLEALWVARELHPDRAIAFSSEAHYTHRRMCEVLGAPALEIAADASGRMDLDDLREKLGSGRIGTVVMTAGTTGLGAVDRIDSALELKKEFDFRIHVDAAYGGFYRLLAGDGLGAEASAAFRAISESDSVVIDPHKHGLQPYGCGSVIFRDPSVGRFYKHDSPYTYFTSNELHLGEISLECSRAGAAAAALWATLRCFPLESGAGLGKVLRKTRRAALAWARLISAEERLSLVVEPELDIVNFYPLVAGGRTSGIGALTSRVFEALMNDGENPVYLAKINLRRSLLGGREGLVWDSPHLTAFRSVLMKPEHEDYVGSLHRGLISKLEQLSS